MASLQGLLLRINNPPDYAQTEYCPTFHFPYVAGVTSQLFSIIWWFRPCKPYILRRVEPTGSSLFRPHWKIAIISNNCHYKQCHWRFESGTNKQVESKQSNILWIKILIWPRTTLHTPLPTLQREIKFRANKRLHLAFNRPKSLRCRRMKLSSTPM